METGLINIKSNLTLRGVIMLQMSWPWLVGGRDFARGLGFFAFVGSTVVVLHRLEDSPPGVDEPVVDLKE